MVGISPAGAYAMLRKGEIPVVRLGGRTLISIKDIEALVAQRTGAFLAGEAAK
jgi:hypothetical protein